MQNLGLRVLATLCFLPLGCDPAGPGAAGNISLDPSVDASKFTVLEVRAYPDASGSFDPKNIPDGAGFSEEQAVKDLTFPTHYELGGGIGTTDDQHWRMTAWLSATAGSKAPATSDPQCSVPFDIDDCSAGFDGYCSTTQDVHCTLK